MIRAPGWSVTAPPFFPLFTLALAFLCGVSPAHGQERLVLPAEGPRLELEAETLYSVGVLDGEPWEVFSGIAAVAFDEEGSLYVLDRGNFRVVKFGPACSTKSRKLSRMPLFSRCVQWSQ